MKRFLSIFAGLFAPLYIAPVYALEEGLKVSPTLLYSGVALGAGAVLVLLFLWLSTGRSLRAQSLEMDELSVSLADEKKRHRAISKDLELSRNAMLGMEERLETSKEERLKEQRRMSSLLQALPVAVSFRDAAGECKYINPVFADKGMDLAAVQQLAASHWQAWDDALEQGESVRGGEEHWSLQDDDSVWSTQLVAVRGPDEKLETVISISADLRVQKAQQHELAELQLDIDNMRDQLRINQGMLDEQFSETGRLAGLLEIADEEAEEAERRNEDILSIRACHVAQGVNALVGLGFTAVDAAVEGAERAHVMLRMRHEALDIIGVNRVDVPESLSAAYIGVLLDDSVEAHMVWGYLQRDPLADVAGAQVRLIADRESLVDLLKRGTFDGVVVDARYAGQDVFDAAEQSQTAVVALGDKEQANAGFACLLPKPLMVASLYEALAEHVIVQPGEGRVAGQQKVLKASWSEVEEEEFPKLAGIDTQMGLLKANNNVDTYRQALLDFMEGADALWRGLEAVATSEDWADMERMAGQLMNDSQALGARMLAKAAENVSLARQRGIELQPLLPPLKASLMFVSHSIQKLLNPVSVPAPINKVRSVDPYVLQPRLVDLLVLIDDHDEGALRCLATIGDNYKDTEIYPELEQIEGRLSKDDYPAAKRLLNALAARLDVALVGVA